MKPLELDLKRLQMVLDAARGQPSGPLRSPPEGRLQGLAQLQSIVGSHLAELRLNDASPEKQLEAINHFFGMRLRGCPSMERTVIADALALATEATLPKSIKGAPKPTDATRASAAQMTNSGCVDMGFSMTPEQVKDIHQHLSDKPILISHVPEQAEGAVPNLESIPTGKNYGCYDHLDLWSAPHILELACREDVLSIAEGYLGCAPTVYSINAFWSLPNRVPHPYSQLFHRDYEDYRSMAYFTFLTPIEHTEDGMHYFVEGSHEMRRFEKLLREDGVGTRLDYLTGGPFLADMSKRLFHRKSKTFMGPAGRSFAEDAFGLHRGLIPRSRPRLLLWIRYGNFFNATYLNIKFAHSDAAKARKILDRIPSNAYHQFMFRYFTKALSSPA